MQDIFFVFYGEAKADYLFVQRIVLRYLNRLLPHIAFESIEVRHLEGNSEQERFINLAKENAGYHFIVIHIDADDNDETKALENHFLPAYELIQNLETANKQLIPIIPIKETEAWLLADYTAFKEVIGTNLSAKMLGFPAQAHEVERLNKPKEILNTAISLARSKRRRIDLDELYQPMGELISLDILEKIPAFQKFQQRMLKLLLELGFRELEQL